jgi:hypothetical protein
MLLANSGEDEPSSGGAGMVPAEPKGGSASVMPASISGDCIDTPYVLITSKISSATQRLVAEGAEGTSRRTFSSSRN